MATTISSIHDQFEALGQQGTYSEDDDNVTVAFNVAPDKVVTVEFAKDREWSINDVHVEIMREFDSNDPKNDPVGPVAGNPKKDKLRSQGVPQPGATVPEDGGPAIETPANEDKTGTPAAGL